LKRVLVVEDEKELSDAICVFLNHFGFETKQAYDGNSALLDIDTFMPQVVLLDVLLPDMHGMDLCRLFKTKLNVGIIFLTALSSKENILLGFKSGADDYIAKPFDLDILMVRIKALINRMQMETTIDDEDISMIRFDSVRNIIVVKNKVVDLTPTEFRIIHYLYETCGYVSTKEILRQLYDKIDTGIPTRTVSVHIAKLRKKLIEANIFSIEINSKYGRGYRLEIDE